MQVRGWRRALAVPVAFVLVGLVAVVSRLVLPDDSTTTEGYVADTWFTAHFAAHVLWACIAAGLTYFLYQTRVPRTAKEAWRQEPGAVIAFAGLCLMVVAQLAEAVSAISLGYGTDDSQHDLAIIGLGFPAQILLGAGLLLWGVTFAIRRVRRAPAKAATP